MALPDRIHYQDGTGIILADNSITTGAFWGSRTDIMNLNGVSNTVAWQSNKIDLGATRARKMAVLAALDFENTPTDENSVEFYWAPSNSGTAGDNNPGGVAGNNSQYSGYSASADKDAGFRQLIHIGSFICTIDTRQTNSITQVAVVGGFPPILRYGTLLIDNISGAQLTATSAVMSVLITPVEDTIID